MEQEAYTSPIARIDDSGQTASACGIEGRLARIKMREEQTEGVKKYLYVALSNEQDPKNAGTRRCLWTRASSLHPHCGLLAFVGTDTTYSGGRNARS